MAIVLVIVLAAALFTAIGFIARMRHEIHHMEDVIENLTEEQEKLRYDNSELEALLIGAFARSRHYEEIARGLAAENANHVASLRLVLAEVDK